MTPATWPLASVPRSVRPSTMLARSIIGVFAAMITCVQVSSWLRFIARPSATMSRQDEPDIFWNAIACPIDRRSLPSEPPPMSWSASGVRSTRCGTPSSTEVTTVSVTVRFRYSAFTESGTGLSLVSRNRVPIAMPAAP